MQTEPRQLLFDKPDNITNYTHGSISTYRDLWNFIESLRYNNHKIGDAFGYESRLDVITQVNSNIINELKTLGCSNVRFYEAVKIDE